MAQATLRVCQRCTAVVRGKCDCAGLQPAVRHNRENRKRYYTARWVRLRQQVLARDNHLCQECKRNGRTEIGNQIDHVTNAEAHPSAFWCADNLQTLCRTCHSRKTVREQVNGRTVAGGAKL